MKKIFQLSTIILSILLSVLSLTSCGDGDAANAENKDTVSTSVEPQPDNATVRPDTMQTQVPQDSAAKDSSK